MAVGDYKQLASKTNRRSFALSQTFHILLGHRGGCLVKGWRQRRWMCAPEVAKRKRIMKNKEVYIFTGGKQKISFRL